MLARASPLILIVEDVEGMLNILGERFAQAGFSVILAHNGDEGIRLAILKKPDIILADVLMPGLSGIEMVRLLRQREECRDIPVMFLSILNEFEYNHGKLSGLTGIAGFLWKNETSLDEVVQKVREFLKHRPAAAG